MVTVDHDKKQREGEIVLKMENNTSPIITNFAEEGWYSGKERN